MICICCLKWLEEYVACPKSINKYNPVGWNDFTFPRIDCKYGNRGRVVPNGAESCNHVNADLGIEVMHERNAQNFWQVLDCIEGILFGWQNSIGWFNSIDGIPSSLLYIHNWAGKIGKEEPNAG